MAAAEGAGVTTHAGEVFGHRNLFVMDGSVIRGRSAAIRPRPSPR